MREDRLRISPTYDVETYEQIRHIANRENKAMADVVREWSLQGLNGTILQSNVEMLTPIIRKQIEAVLQPQMERMIALTAKTCVQASTAAYLSADAILKFVPPAQREEVRDSYEAARKKAVLYMKNKTQED